MIVLGVDAGGSKTHAVLARETGEVIGVGTSGCANWEVTGLDGAGTALLGAIEEAFREAGASRSDVAASAYGLAGLDWPSDEGRLSPVVDALDFCGPRLLVNDAFLPLRSGTENGVGLAAIAGSGATVVGRNAKGERDRSFGAGYPFTDWGGAWDLAGGAIHAVALSHRGMAPDTALTDAMLSHAACDDVYSMCEGIMREEVQVGGDFAPVVISCAEKGDAAAIALVERAGRTIGENAVSVARNLDMLNEAFLFVGAGGVFSSGSTVLLAALNRVLTEAAPGAQFVHWEAPPVVGAILLAMDLLKISCIPSPQSLATSVKAKLAPS